MKQHYQRRHQDHHHWSKSLQFQEQLVANGKKGRCGFRRFYLSVPRIPYTPRPTLPVGRFASRNNDRKIDNLLASSSELISWHNMLASLVG
ncbi:hypothetical protein CPAR01_09700 [Colletotrichum paranaense]|uniref:Uncharacterized protein n=1 Tax=Colletotrichum paranaense TaxID=1914294 RepID=A0ABQ9SIN8_9PEZI|nr:uncharacterized protein CPAR01_09700 [Colletotrichum paranaense]KAK1536158.1 hypothetical protein CPAR01_09700 [Colletotrichum paranaense]